MLDITDPKLYQNFLTIEIQLTLFVIVVLFCALTVLRYCKMDLLRASEHKQRFYGNYDTELSNSTMKMLQAAAIATDPLAILPETPPLSSQASTSSQRTSSNVSVNLDSNSILSQSTSIANEFINKAPHRTCETCKNYEKELQIARSSLDHSNTDQILPTFKAPNSWADPEAKATLDEYEEFIDGMMRRHERVQIDHDVMKLHVKNLTTAFSNLQSKYQKAKATISGLQRNEKLLFSQLSKYETMFQLIADTNQRYQDQEMQKEQLRLQIKAQKESEEAKKLMNDKKPLIRKKSQIKSARFEKTDKVDKKVDTNCML